MTAVLRPNYENPLNAQLDPGEQLLWTGRPIHGFVLRASDAFLIPFGILWLGFCLLWEGSALGISFHGLPAKLTLENYFMGLWGLPFIAIGFHLLVFRFFVDAWQRRRTYYAVTNTRAIVVLDGVTRRIQSISLAAAPVTELIEHRDGTGTILFSAIGKPDQKPQPKLRSFRLGSLSTGIETPKFEFIENASEACRIIRAVQQPA